MNKKIQKNNGMTYVELIVVLSIFSVLSSVAIFNYGAFQDRIDIKNLASDIALKIVEAQKSSINGLLPLAGYNPDTWKPSYGVYFDISVPKQFIYFADLDNNNFYNGLSSYTTTEYLDKIIITKNNVISNIDNCSSNPCTPSSINPLSITFQRPDSKADFFTNQILTLTGSGYIQITILSPKGAKALIKIYPSGRVQVN